MCIQAMPAYGSEAIVPSTMRLNGFIVKSSPALCRPGATLQAATMFRYRPTVDAGSNHDDGCGRSRTTNWSAHNHPANAVADTGAPTSAAARTQPALRGANAPTGKQSRSAPSLRRPSNPSSLLNQFRRLRWRLTPSRRDKYGNRGREYFVDRIHHESPLGLS